MIFSATLQGSSVEEWSTVHCKPLTSEDEGKYDG